MTQDQKKEQLQEITKTAQNLKTFSTLSLFFVVLYILLFIFSLTKEITMESIINSLGPVVVLLLLSGFLGQMQKGFEAIKTLLEDKE